MNRLFTQYELSYLDDIMPGDDKNKEEDELKKHDNDVNSSFSSVLICRFQSYSRKN